MLFFLLDTLLSSPSRFLALLPVFLATIILSMIVGLTVHEFAHALAAHLLGDDTAKRAGRLSLNPLRHLDPLGSIMMFVVGIGWGKPVPVDPRMLPDSRRGMALVAAAGPFSNFVTAGLLAVPIKLGLIGFHSPGAYLPQSIVSSQVIPSIFGYAIFFNLLLGIFNLLPISPLDGFKVLLGIAPRNLSLSLARFEQYGMLILMLVFALDWVTNAGIFWRFIQAPANALGSLFVGRPFL